MDGLEGNVHEERFVFFMLGYYLYSSLLNKSGGVGSIFSQGNFLIVPEIVAFIPRVCEVTLGSKKEAIMMIKPPVCWPELLVAES